MPAMFTTPSLPDLFYRLRSRLAPWFTPDRRPLTIALIVSIGLHVALLTLHFVAPVDKRKVAIDQPMEVVLVNSQTDSKPIQANFLAQLSLDGGGDHDQGKATSPLSRSAEETAGDAPLQATRRRLKKLEEEQKKLMDQLRKSRFTTQPDPPTPDKPEPDNAPDGFDPFDSVKELARQMAVIENRVEEYNKRPRKHFFSPSTSEYRFAQYVEDWRRKIERIGTLNYPEAARGKIYGSLRLTVFIRADGSIESIDMDKASEHRVLNEAALRIIKLSAPFAPFPANLRQDTDVLAISRTWIFTNDALETTGRVR